MSETKLRDLLNEGASYLDAMARGAVRDGPSIWQAVDFVERARKELSAVGDSVRLPATEGPWKHDRGAFGEWYVYDTNGRGGFDKMTEAEAIAVRDALNQVASRRTEREEK